MRKKNQLFVKYLFINLGMIFAVLIGCLAEVVYTYKLEKRNVIEQSEEELTRSISEMEKMLNSIYSLSSALRSNNSLKELSRYQGETLPKEKYVEMKKICGNELSAKRFGRYSDDFQYSGISLYPISK